MTKIKNTSIRLGENLEELINQYCAFTRKDRSKVIREGLTEWLFQRTKHVQFDRLNNYLAKRDPFEFMNKCEKCEVTENLVIYHIDGNIENNVSENLITICKQCFINFERFRQKRNIKEEFIEWFLN